MEWEQVDKRELERLYYDENLSDAAIANRFGVTKYAVQKKRKLYHISMQIHSIDTALQEQPGLADGLYQKEVSNILDPELLAALNQRAKERFIRPENIDTLAKALTHYIFRLGPVENMHANKQLSQKDMKTLNQYMVNHLAWVLTRAFEGDWLRLELLFGAMSRYGTDWDPADPQQVENR